MSYGKFRRSSGRGYRRNYRKRRRRRGNYNFTKKVGYALQKLAEHKYKDITGTGEFIDYNGTMHHLSAIAEGSTANQREGDKITPVRLTLRWNCAYVGGTFVGIRVIILQWKDSDIPTPSDVVESTASVLATESPYSRDTGSKYKVLRDIRSNVTDQKPYVEGKISINLRNQKNRILYDGSNSTDILNNALYILLFSNVDGANEPNFVYYSRLAFTDI